jgi:hypothetical protein
LRFWWGFKCFLDPCCLIINLVLFKVKCIH